MPPRKKKTVRKTFPVELDEQLHKDLKHRAIEHDMTLHDYIVDVLGSKVAETPPPYGGSTERKGTQ